MARKPRLTEENGYYHVVSRIVGREFRIQGAEEKDAFVEIFRSMEAFSGCRVLTYVVLDNHFHLLLHIPPRESVFDNEELDTRMKHIYAKDTLAAFWAHQKRLREQGGASVAEADRLRDQVIRRMYSLPAFMKAVKQRFTQCHNKRHQRRGTLWEGRYKSVLIEGAGHPLFRVAAYIDLNPIRAGIVQDPKSYRWCGYGAAMGGVSKAKQGLDCLLATVSGESEADRESRGMAEYRMLLYGVGEEKSLNAKTGGTSRRGFSPEETLRVLQSGGEVPVHELLRLRLRFMVDGVMIGSRARLETFFHHRPEFFGPRRQSAARKTALPTIFSLRGLRHQSVSAGRVDGLR